MVRRKLKTGAWILALAITTVVAFLLGAHHPDSAKQAEDFAKRTATKALDECKDLLHK